MKQNGGLSNAAVSTFLLNVNSCWGMLGILYRLSRFTYTARTTILLTVYQHVW
jgi:hypothetical protein